MAYFKLPNGGYEMVMMHRYIMGAKKGDPRKVDHRDHTQTLNNQDSNLRFATQTEQTRNRGKYKTNTTGFTGVYWSASGKYRAGLRVDKKMMWFGAFDEKEEAARVRDKAAIKYHGDFAVTNFPRSDYEQAA